MALARAAGLCRLALRTQWAAVHLLGSTAAGEALPSGEDSGRRIDLVVLRRERALRPASKCAPPAPQHKVYSTPKPAPEQLRLNKDILARATAEAVLDLVTPRLAELNEVNASTALLILSRRARLSGAATWLSGDPRFTQLLHATESLFGRMEAQALSNSLYACGQLGITPPFDWLERYWGASSRKLGKFKPQELSNVLYACGQLGITPLADWLQRYWHSSVSALAEYKPQELSNTLYACGQLGVMPPADWQQHFWDASASQLDEFKSQELSNTVYACRQLLIKPPDDWLQRFFDVTAAKLGRFKPQNLSNTLHACATLGVTPPSDWLQQFSSACERQLPDLKHQELSNTALSLATLGLWELPLWPGIWERLCVMQPLTGWSAEDRLHAHQLCEVYLAAAVERPGLLRAPSSKLLAAARRSRSDAFSKCGRRSSKFHAGISATLTQMGVTHANEVWCERAERKVDIAIDGAPPIAVEVDGPTHFLSDGGPTGHSLFRNRLLAIHGWRVVVVNYRHWDGPKTQEQREEYLRRILA